MRASRFTSACAPAADAHDDDPPADRQRLEVARQVRPADHLEHHVVRALAACILGCDDVAPSRRPRRAPRPRPGARSLRTVVTTRAPARAASCTPATPTPPAPPCTSTRSPIVSPHWVNERVVGGGEHLGEPAGLAHDSRSGTGSASRSCTTARSACPPPATTAITRSPGRNRTALDPRGEHHPGELQAGDVRRHPGWRRVEALPLEQSAPLRPAACTVDEQLVVAGHRIRVLTPPQSAIDRPSRRARGGQVGAASGAVPSRA